MIILDVEVVAPGSEVGERIGSPVNWSGDGPAPNAAPAAAPNPPAPAPAPAPVPSTSNGVAPKTTANAQQRPQTSPFKAGGSNGNGMCDNVFLNSCFSEGFAK